MREFLYILIALVYIFFLEVSLTPFETIFDMVNIEIHNKTFYGTVKCQTFSVIDFAIVLFLQQANNKRVRKVTMTTF